MVRKLIAFSFEPEAVGGFAIVCNGVHYARNSAFSHMYPITKPQFIEALKDRIKFNDLLGIDIRDGWQNALKDAIEPFTTMSEDYNPEELAKIVATIDMKLRGQEAVEKDMATLEKDNEQLVAEVEKEVKNDEKPAKDVKKSRKTVKKVQKEAKNDERRDDTVAVVSEDNGCTENPELPAENPSTPDNA